MVQESYFILYFFLAQSFMLLLHILFLQILSPPCYIVVVCFNNTMWLNNKKKYVYPHSVHFQCSLFFCVDSDIYPVPFFFCLNFISNSYSVNSGDTFFNFFMSGKAHIYLYFWNIFFSCVKSTLSFLFQYFKHIALLSFGLQCF